jgi:hypothetical protein
MSLVFSLIVGDGLQPRLPAAASADSTIRWARIMGIHDDYDKQVTQTAIGTAYADWGPPVQMNLGTGDPARVDGAIGSLIAVEVE